MEVLLLVVGCVSTVLLVTALCSRLPIPAPLLLLLVGAVVSTSRGFRCPN